ncbi:MAG: hypothetical protein WBN19_05555 [Lutimonas sp.]
MVDTKFVKRKRPNNKRILILLLVLVLILILFFNLDRILEGFLTIQE